MVSAGLRLKSTGFWRTDGHAAGMGSGGERARGERRGCATEHLSQ